MIAHTTPRCDAADLPQSSVQAETPLDSWEDIASEILATAVETVIATRLGMSLPPDTFRQVLFTLLVGPIAAALEEAADGQIAGGRRSEHEMVNGLITEIRRFPNPYLALRCLPIVFRLPCSDETETELSAEFGVSRAAVSKYCIDLQDRLKVPPGRGMRSPETRAKYAQRQRGKRARPLPIRYAWQGIAAAIKTLTPATA